MRVIHYKHSMRVDNFKVVMRFLRKLLISINLFRWKFELIKTNKTYQIKFQILRSKLSRVEEQWLDNELRKYIYE